MKCSKCNKKFNLKYTDPYINDHEEKHYKLFAKALTKTFNKEGIKAKLVYENSTHIWKINFLEHMTDNECHAFINNIAFTRRHGDWHHFKEGYRVKIGTYYKIVKDSEFLGIGNAFIEIDIK